MDMQSVSLSRPQEHHSIPESCAKQSETRAWFLTLHSQQIVQSQGCVRPLLGEVRLSRAQASQPHAVPPQCLREPARPSPACEPASGVRPRTSPTSGSTGGTSPGCFRLPSPPSSRRSAMASGRLLPHSHLLPRVGLRHRSPELRGAERLAATPPGDLIYSQH
jgi:hypothetical protein